MSVQALPKPAQPAPIVNFYRAIPGCRAPMPADPSVLGTAPSRAFQYCEAMRTASAYGWYVFSPLDFTLQWDGSEVVWTYDGAKAWFPLKSAQFPGYAAHFDRVAPRRLRGTAPPFLSYMRELSLLQVWTGLFVETAPDWSVLVRPPANLPRHHGLELYEGIVETDRWFGPLFTNIRLVRTDMPIHFSTETPLLQVQPVHRASYASGVSSRYGYHDDADELPAHVWSRYEETIVKPSLSPERPVAAYAAAVRKRRKSECPYSAGRG